MKKKVKIFISMFSALFLMIALSLPVSAQPPPDLGLDEYDWQLPEEVSDDLEQNGVTPESIAPDFLSVDSALKYIFGLFTDSVSGPIKLTVSVIALILLCAVSDILCDTAGKDLHGVFSLVSVLVGAALLMLPISSLISSTGELVKAGCLFVEGFIPAFAGMIALGGRITAAAAVNTVVMAGAQAFAILASNIIMPAASCIMGVTLAGSVDPELKLGTLAEAAKKIIIWGLGLTMTLFVALLSLQSFITLPADGIAIKAARFTVANGVPFIGGTVSDALSVMQGGINVIRSNFGSFGIIAGGAMMLPSMVSVLLYKLAMSVSAAVSDMFGLPPLTGLLKCSESILSIILAVLVCFMLIIVISVSLMIFIGTGGTA